MIRELLARFGYPLSYFQVNKHKNSLETSIDSFVQLKFRDKDSSRKQVDEFVSKIRMIGSRK